MKIFFGLITGIILFILFFTFNSFGVDASTVLVDYREVHNKLSLSDVILLKDISKPIPNEDGTSGKKTYTDGEVNPFIYYSQIGAPWSDDDYSGAKAGTVASSGCGPTAFAMCVASLNPEKSVTPRDIALYSVQNGYRTPTSGTSYNLFFKGLKEYGLQYSSQDIGTTSVVTSLEEGKIIVMNMGPGKSPEDARKVVNTWTSGGHYIVLRGVTQDGKILVGDPNSDYNTEKSWDFDKSIKPFNGGFCIKVWK